VNTLDLTGLTDTQLYELVDEGRALWAEAKAAMAAVEAEVSRRQESTAADVFRAARKEYGSATYTDAEGRKFKAEARREVKWDSDKLQEIASSMPWSEVSAVFDIKFSVPERVYNTMNDLQLRTRLDAARTTKTGDLRVIYVGRDVGNDDRP
jgi:hypothetical protein